MKRIEIFRRPYFTLFNIGQNVCYDIVTFKKIRFVVIKLSGTAYGKEINCFHKILG